MIGYVIGYPIRVASLALGYRPPNRGGANPPTRPDPTRPVSVVVAEGRQVKTVTARGFTSQPAGGIQ